jgi:DNA repair exonuclease SbcCD ATPase subunit
MDANAKAKIDLFNTKQSIKGIGEMNNYLNKIETTATSLGTKLKSISFDHIDTSKIEKIQNELKEIQDTAKQDINLDDMVKVGGILSDLDKISNEIKNLEKVENLASSFEKISSSVTDTSGDIERLSSEIKSLENVADSLDGSFGKAFSSASKGVKDFQSDIKKLQKDTSSSSSGKSIFGDWDDLTGSFSRFKIADLAGDAIADTISQMATAWKDTIVETDSAITDLNKVLDKGGRLTGQSLDNYLGQVTQVAKGTGKSSTDVIQGTARAVQSGIKSTEDALKYAEKSAMFANIGDMTQEEADKILTSVMSANGGIENSLKQTSSHLGKATEGYSKLEEFIDMANHAGELSPRY